MNDGDDDEEEGRNDYVFYFLLNISSSGKSLVITMDPRQIRRDAKWEEHADVDATKEQINSSSNENRVFCSKIFSFEHWDVYHESQHGHSNLHIVPLQLSFFTFPIANEMNEIPGILNPKKQTKTNHRMSFSLQCNSTLGEYQSSLFVEKQKSACNCMHSTGTHCTVNARRNEDRRKRVDCVWEHAARACEKANLEWLCNLFCIKNLFLRIHIGRRFEFDYDLVICSIEKNASVPSACRVLSGEKFWATEMCLMKRKGKNGTWGSLLAHRPQAHINFELKKKNDSMLVEMFIHLDLEFIEYY